MKLELMWINSAMKRGREGFETSPAECPPVECRQSDGATDTLYRKDRVSQSASDAGWVRSVSLTWQHREEEKDQTLMLRPIVTDRTRPVVVEQLWELTGREWTLESCVRS